LSGILKSQQAGKWPGKLYSHVNAAGRGLGWGWGNRCKDALLNFDGKPINWKN